MPSSESSPMRPVPSPNHLAAWARRPRSIPGSVAKTTEWLTQGDAASLLGTSCHTSSFKKVWYSLVDAALAGRSATAHGVTVRMSPCTIKGVDRWCAHREDMVHLAAHTQRRERRWPIRPEGWLTLEEAADRARDNVDPDVMADAWRALTKGTAYEGYARIAGLDIQLRRGHVYATERWFIHPADAVRLVEATRGRLPHLRKGYSTPAMIAARVHHDARPLARAAMADLAAGRAATGVARLDGEPVEMRRFLVEGKPTDCLSDRELPRFMRSVTEMYDLKLADEVACLGL